MSIRTQSFGSVLVSVIRFASNLISPLRGWVKRKSQRYKEQGSQAQLAGDLDLAEKYFQEALVWQHEDADLHSTLGQVFYDQDKSMQAEEHFRQALDYDYGNLPALKGLGLVLQERGDLSEPLYLYLKYLQFNPNDAVVCHNLGTVFHNLGDYKTAVEYYKRAEQGEPNDPLILKNHAMALIALGNFEEAKTTLFVARDSAPEDAEVDQLLGSALEAQGDNEAAMETYLSALRKDPKSPDTHMQSASLAIDLHRYQDGKEHSQEAADLYLQAGDKAAAGEAYWELGWSYYMLNDWPKSLEAGQRALKWNPELNPVHFNLGLALLQMGRVDEARSEYEEGIKLLGTVSDLKEHGIDDLQEALEKSPALTGGKEILERLVQVYEILSQDVAKSAQQSTA